MQKFKQQFKIVKKNEVVGSKSGNPIDENRIDIFNNFQLSDDDKKEL